MMTTHYTARSSARRAARARGVDPDAVYKTDAGYTFDQAAPESDRALGLPTASAAFNSALNAAAREGAGEMPEIPDFLLVKNRKKPTKAEQARIDAFMGRQSSEPERVDWRKPKGMPWAEWDAIQTRAAEERRAKTEARVAELKEKYGDRKRAPKPRKPRREDEYQHGDFVTVLVDANPCRPGTAAHAVFACYRSGMTVAQFIDGAASKCPGKLRPIDYLIYDSRKGRISVGARPPTAAKPAAKPSHTTKGRKKKK